jgi:hypothetical protein
MDSICGRSQRAAVPALPGIYAVITSIEATGSASNPSRAPALARTMASICAVDWLPTRSQDHLRRAPVEETQLPEVGVLRHNRKPAGLRVLPQSKVIPGCEAYVAHVLGGREEIGEPSHELRREVLIEQELQAAGTDNSRRSRSAANARQARMSSEVRSGKSASISASDMPDARYSSTSYTVMRSPRMHGLPPRFPGSIVTIPR